MMKHMVKTLFCSPLLFTLCLLMGSAAAQEADVTPAVPESGIHAERIGIEGTEVTGTDTDDEVLLGSFGLSTGFPGYQQLAVSAGVQYRFVGLALKGGYTAAGPYLGFALRAYPPIPGPVPLFVSTGLGFYGDSTAFELTAGGHVPIAENFRVNIEAGASRVTAFGDSQWLPFVSAGISYVVPFIPDAQSAQRSSQGLRSTAAGRSDCGLPPDEGALTSAFSRTLTRFIANGRATYAGTYTDLDYSYRIIDVSVSGDSGSVTIEYEGSVRTILGGHVEQASGTASASFHWNGCGWSRTSLDY
jgi:hypothetical protein